jgi:transcriptional regulator with XRE-family HTH domain
MTAGLTQARLARAAEVSQQLVSDAERGRAYVSLEIRCRLTAACGHELGWRLHPVATVSLRDSGQLQFVQSIARAAHSSWAAQVEHPIAPGDLRAADLVLGSATEVLHIELERVLVDVQAQVRAAQLKRTELAQRESRPVRLIMAFPDTARNRAQLMPISDLVTKTFPIRSRAVWGAIRAGTPIGGDGVLFVRADRGAYRP